MSNENQKTLANVIESVEKLKEELIRLQSTCESAAHNIESAIDYFDNAMADLEAAKAD